MKTMILGTGSYAPEKILTNADLEKIVETSDEWIKERSGIERRHIIADDQNNSDMALEASKRALEAAGLKPEDIDAIIVGTVSGDNIFPSTACRLQAKLGAENAAAYDLSAACSGFIYGLSIADSYIKSGMCKYVLVIGSEALSRLTDYSDRTTCVLFGDASGAAVVGPSDGKSEILSNYIKSDGRLGDLLHLPAGGTALPASYETVDQHLHYIKMAGREVFKHAVRAMTDAAVQALRKAGLHSGSDIDLLIPHQANTRIIYAIAHRLHLPDEKVYVNIQEYGNTSAATIPVALDEALRNGRLKEGMRCLLVAFGGGFTWGASVIQF